MKADHTSVQAPLSVANAHLVQVKPQEGENISEFADLRPEAIAQRQLRSDITQSGTGNIVHEKAIVQRQIAHVTQTLPEEIRGLATAYNGLAEETGITDRINSLSGVEHAVYAWLRANRAPDMNDLEGASIVQAFMNDVKAERARVVEHSISVSQDHLGEGGIPIAGFDTLGEEAQGDVRAIWQGLIAGTDSIRIRETESDTNEEHEGFRIKVLIEFSRLLEGEFGKSMIRDINESENLITIEPFHQINDHNKSFAAGPTSDVQGIDKLTRLVQPPAEEELEHYPETNITEMDEPARRALIDNLKPTEDGQLGVRLRDGDLTTYFRFGAGSAVRVFMPSDLNDSSQQKESRLADADENELATPVFITLGHELGHGKHMQRGTLTNETAIPNFFGAENDQRAYIGDSEEYVNIEENENSIRAEHGLGRRKGHVNIPYLQKERMWAGLNERIEWLAGLGPIGELPAFQQIDNLLSSLGNDVYTRWAEPEQLELLKARYAALPRAMIIPQVAYVNGALKARLKQEYTDMMLTFYRPRLEYNSGMQIPMMLDLVDREIEYEIGQALAAANDNQLAAYLQGLPAQRQAYMEGRISDNLADIGQSVESDHDIEQFGRMNTCMAQFGQVHWLFH